MIGHIYDIEVSVDCIHDWAKKTIREIYFPDIRLYVNAEHAFYEYTDIPRRRPDTWETVHVDDTIMLTFDHIVKSKLLIHENIIERHLTQ